MPPAMSARQRVERVLIAGHPAAVHIREARNPTAPIILALHGFTGSGEDFLELGKTLGLDRFTWICPDFMGHGFSAKPERIDPYLFCHALRLIDAARGLARTGSKIYLLAYSMGGRIALHYLRWARPMPTIVVGTSPGIEEQAERRTRRKADTTLIDPESMTIDAFCDRWEANPLIAPQTRLREPVRSALKHRRRRNSLTGLRNSLLACGTGSLPSLWNHLSELPPVLLVYGRDDTRFSGISGRMARANAAFRTVAIPDSGHAPHLENPEALARVLIDSFR